MATPFARPLRELEHAGEFIPRHIGIGPDDERHMLGVIGEASRQALIEGIVPRAIARRAIGSASAPTMVLVPSLSE